MIFNTKKCYVLSINNKSSRYYQLEKHTLQEVQDNLYRQSSANKRTDELTQSGRSFIWHKNIIGPSTVQDNPYLGLQISNDLNWSIHINNVCKKANATRLHKRTDELTQSGRSLIWHKNIIGPSTVP
jgi:hypothetical protein